MIYEKKQTSSGVAKAALATKDSWEAFEALEKRVEPLFC